MASRNLTAPMLAAIAAGTVRPGLLYEGEFVSGGSPAFLNLWSGVGLLSWDSKTWTGGGQLMGLSPIEESRQMSAVGFTVTLSGMPSSLIATALANVRQGRPGKLWLALFDAAGAIIADPYPLQSGRLDVSLIEDAGETCTISVQYESRLVDLERARERRWTHEDQQIDHVGDLGFEYVAALQDMQITWGGPAAAASPIANPVIAAGAASDSGNYSSGF